MRIIVHTERGSFQSRDMTPDADERVALIDAFRTCSIGDASHLKLERDDGYVFISGELLNTAVIEVIE